MFTAIVAASAAAEPARYEKLRLAPPSTQSLRVVLRTNQYLQVDPAGARGSARPRVQPLPFVDDLVALPAQDSALAIELLNTQDLEALGLSPQQAFDLGVANLRQTLKPLMEIAEVTRRAQIGELAGDPFYPSRLLLLDSWTPLAEAQGGVLIVAAPTTDTVLYIGEDTPTAIAALRAQVAAMQSSAPNRLSDTLLRWQASGWTVVPKLRSAR